MNVDVLSHAPALLILEKPILDNCNDDIRRGQGRKGHTATCTQTTKSSRAENHDWLLENQDNFLLGKKLQNLLIADAKRTNLKRVSVYQTINACKVWEGKEVYSWKRRWTKVCGLSPHSFGLFKVFSQLFGQLLLTSLDHQECWVCCIRGSCSLGSAPGLQLAI